MTRSTTAVRKIVCEAVIRKDRTAVLAGKDHR